MKRYIAGMALAILGLLQTPVSAFDQCCYDSCYDPCCDYNPCCGPDFDGFYIGANLGALSYTAHRNDQNGFLTDHGSYTLRDTGFTGGLQLGWDRNCNNRVYGLVWDFNGTSADKKIYDNDNTNYVKAELDWWTSIRARSGLVVNDTLLYITGGVAWARVKTTWNDDPNHFSNSGTHVGLIGGFGAETVVCDNWSVGGEFLYTEFGDKSHHHTEAGGTRRSFNHADNSWLARITINYHFDDLCNFCR